MKIKNLGVLLLGGLGAFFLAPHPASAAPLCSVAYENVRTAPDLNAEGTTERGADIVNSGVGCFTTGEILTVSYKAVKSVPASFALADRGVYWDLADPTDSLTVGGISVQTATSATGTVTVIEFDIENGTNSPSASITLENLRFDVTGTTGKGYQMVPDGQSLWAYVGTSNPTSVTNPFDIGNVKKTVDGRAVQVGWGFEDGVCPFPGGCGYPNKGATTGSLIQQAIWAFRTNPAWYTDFPFRRTNEKSPNPADPHLIGPTDLIVDVENIMSGVTVTLPNALVVCSDGAPVATWTFASGSKTATGGNLVGIYQTTQSTRLNPVTLVVYTTDGSADPGCDATSTYPLISVKVGNPSGNSADGSMEAYLRVAMGPASAAQFKGDDVQPSAVPRYLNTVSATSAPTRIILGDTNPEYQPYFFLNPTQTVLLYPYVTNLSGWQTGIEVGNTGLDTPVFGNSGQAGALDFYFFPTGGTPFEYTTKAGNGRGLDANGNLQAGGDFADTLNDLLSLAGHAGNFEGYLIVVAHFNYGHGLGMVFNTAGANSAVPALVLGGRCSFNSNVSTDPPPIGTGSPVTFGLSEPPACSSARQGDLTKLPERLDQ